MNNHILETPNLFVKLFTFDDTSFIRTLTNTEGWLSFIGDKNIRSDEDACRYLETGPMQSYRENGYGLWRVSMKPDDVPIGMCGFVRRKGLPGPDIGFAFMPGFTGKGYAIEAVTAVITYGFAALNLDKILAITMKENTRSINLLQKAGLRYTRDIMVAGQHGEEELMLFSLDRST
jgi:RimJ/RimL family protein N-acetyltransferase